MKSRIASAALRVASIAAVPVAALSMAAATAGAQGYGQRELFEWRGNVDQEIRIEMQGGRASTMAMGPRERTGYNNARTMSGVPATNGYVSVQMREGRGTADVVQQPNARNGYTAIVRIRDPQGGAGQYDVAAFWQPANGNYGYGNAGVYDGQYGQYGNSGQYGQYGGAYGYPSGVIVQQPVYQGQGKTLPSGDRGPVYQSRDAYPANGGYSRYPNGNGRNGKTLPGETQQGQNGQQGGYRHRRDGQDGNQQANQQRQNGQQGKTLPGQSSDQQNQQNGRWQRDH